MAMQTITVAVRVNAEMWAAEYCLAPGKEVGPDAESYVQTTLMESAAGQAGLITAVTGISIEEEV